MATKLNVEETLVQARSYFLQGDYDSASFYYKKLKRREIWSEEVSFGITVGTAVKMTKNKIESQLWAVMAAYDRLVNVADTYDFTKEEDQKVFVAVLKSIAYLCVLMRQIIKKEDDRLDDPDRLEWTDAQSKWYDRTEELYSLEAFMVYHVLDMFWVKLRDKIPNDVGTQELQALTIVALRFSIRNMHGDIRSRLSNDQILNVKERIKTYMKERCPDWELPKDPDEGTVQKVNVSPETDTANVENKEAQQAPKPSEWEDLRVKCNELNSENEKVKEEVQKKRLDRARLNYVLLHSANAELYMIVVILLGWTGLPLLYIRAHRIDAAFFLFLYYFIQLVARSPYIAIAVEASLAIMALYKLLTNSTIDDRIVWIPEVNKK